MLFTKENCINRNFNFKLGEKNNRKLYSQELAKNAGTNNYTNDKKKPGFTLIEMIIVISIIGILAGIVAISFGDAQKKAKLNADYANASNLAMAAYMSLGDGKSETDSKDPKKLKDSKYIQTVPKPQSLSGDYEIVIDKGEVTVKVDKSIFYPKPDACSAENQ